MDITDVDLNLLVVLDALLRARSVTIAAQQLGMSQPATSFALKRLRKTFGDPLFVRSSRGIHPTPFAEGLAVPLTGVIDRIRADLLQQPKFDPATTQRAVTFDMHDIGELVFLPRILDRLTDVAPGVQVRTVNLPMVELQTALHAGDVDLAIGHFPDLASGSLYQQRLFTHTFVCIVRAGHPVITGDMSRKQFLEGRHAVVHPAGKLNDTLEAELQAQGLSRQVSVRIEHFLAVPMVLERSDLIFTVPYAIGTSLAKLAAIKLVKPPFRAPPRIVRQHWHSRFHHDPANRWLRSLVAGLFVDKGARGRERQKIAR